MLWHGYKEAGTSWGMTPDGREGFQTLLLRRRYRVYSLDQPRRGNAAKTTVASPVDTATDEQWFYNQFRIGLWPDPYPGGQFPPGPDALAQFFRQMVPDTGPLDADLLVDTTAALFDQTGAAILLTHSHACGFGWLTTIANPNVNGVVALEPGSGFVFPDGEAPPRMPSSAGTLEAVTIPAGDFERLTRVPIAVYFGDNIPTEPTDIAGRDDWRTRFAMARLWVDASNRHGGDATLIHLPAVGITGDTHFLFSDLNNTQILDHITTFLTSKQLD